MMWRFALGPDAWRFFCPIWAVTTTARKRGDWRDNLLNDPNAYRPTRTLPADPRP
jgi:hypothetical protein